MWEKEGVARYGIECYYTSAQRLEYNPYSAFSSPYVIFGAMGERKIAAHVKLFLNLENLEKSIVWAKCAELFAAVVPRSATSSAIFRV